MNSLAQIDKTVFNWINVSWSNGILDAFMPLISHLGDPMAVCLWILLISILSTRQLVHEAKISRENVNRLKIIKTAGFSVVYLALIYGVNAGIYTGLKHLFFRLRPFVENDVILRVSSSIASNLYHTGSFPSGHACNAFMLAVIFSARFRRKRYLFYMMAVLVALSRVYLGVHYPSDVIAGSLLGAVLTSLMLFSVPLPPKTFTSR